MVGTLIIKVSEERGSESHADEKTLGLSASLLYLGGETASNYVKLTWNFSSAVNLIDWIGIFQTDQCNPLLYMDYKNYGVCGSKSGSVNWNITESHIPNNNNNKNINVKNNNNNHLDYPLEKTKPETDYNNNNSLCFKYYDGLTGALRATSPPLLVYSDAQISVTSIVCKELTKSKSLSYYSKISCSGTETCNYRTPYSSDACWTELNFLFPVDRSCELKFSIKERHWSGDRTLGLLNIPIIDLVQRSNQDLAFVLRTPPSSINNTLKGNPKHVNKLYSNNNHCQIVVSCRLIPQLRQSYIDTMSSLVSPTQQHLQTQQQQQQQTNNNRKSLNSLKANYLSNKVENSSQTSDQTNQIYASILPSTTSNSLTNSTHTESTVSMCSISSTSSNSLQQNVTSSDCAAHENIENAQPSSSSSLSTSSSITSKNSLNSLVSISNLPRGWEVRADRHGRLIYLDHVNKRTTWHPPAILESEVVQNDKRYICARRTVISQGHGNNHDHLDKETVKCSIKRDDEMIKMQCTTELTDSTDKYAEERANSIAEKSKAIHFLQRKDFLHVLEANTKALKLYNQSAYLKHIIHRIRREPAKFGAFERNRELVEFLNLFADRTQPLPPGWQTARHCGSAEQRLFIDHKSRRITLIDPRLPEAAGSKRRARSAPPTRRNAQARTLDVSGNVIWDVLNRADELQILVAEQFPELAPKLCRKLQLISRMGEVALMRFANDVDLITAISALEHTSKQPTTEFEEKLNYFYNSLQKAGYGQGPGKIHFRLRRAHLMNDAFDKILAVDSNYLKKYHMTVTFDEEDGLDYGGPSRELFFLLSRELFNPYYGLFEYSANDTYTVQISPISKFVDNYLQWMELCGRVLGLALIHRCMIDTFFTRAFYKFLLRIPYKIIDLQSMDSQFHNSLSWIRENKITADLDLTFSTTEEVGGEIIEKELLPDGKNVLVTESNKEDYISLVLKWRMERSVEQQGQALLRGLYSIIDRDYLRIFDGEQLELVLSGTVEIDIEDWRENTEYKGGYYDGHIVINWFWQTVYSLCNADRLKLLQFVTGTSSVPYEGFKALRGSNGPKKFTIEKWGSEESLPRAHTCFNRLDLPSYPTQKILLTKLKMAIYESSCYSIE